MNKEFTSLEKTLADHTRKTALVASSRARRRVLNIPDNFEENKKYGIPKIRNLKNKMRYKKNVDEIVHDTA